MAQKRKINFVSMEDKLLALKRLDKGESVKKIAVELGVGKSTIGDWKKNRTNIEQWCSKQASGSGMKVRKTMKKSDHPAVEEALFLWHEHLRGKGLPVTGPLLHEKALKFKLEIEGESGEFTASDGWIDRWKKRYGVRQVTISGESLSANKEAVPRFKSYLFELMDDLGISGEQLYNCDETGLNYRMLPSKTLASKKETSAPGYKKSKERVTILACSNATGTHKLRLTLIGKSKTPRAFKKLKQTDTLPLWYTNQKKAWMNSFIFKTWFEKEFVPAVEKNLAANNLPRKAILLIDNAPSHPASDILQDGDIKAVFLPANVTSVCQPMDQGILEALKKKYRHRLLSCLIEAIDSGSDVVEKLKKIDMLDVIRWISEGWNEIPAISFVRSWKILLDHKASDIWDENETTNDNIALEDREIVSLLEKIPGCENASHEDVAEWFSQDKEEEVTEDDIVAMVLNNPEEKGEDDEPADETSQIKIPHSEGFDLMEKALAYINQQEEATAADVICFRRWRDIAAAKRDQRHKQTTVTDFFKKI